MQFGVAAVGRDAQAALDGRVAVVEPVQREYAVLDLFQVLGRDAGRDLERLLVSIPVRPEY